MKKGAPFFMKNNLAHSPFNPEINGFGKNFSFLFFWQRSFSLVLRIEFKTILLTNSSLECVYNVNRVNRASRRLPNCRAQKIAHRPNHRLWARGALNSHGMYLLAQPIPRTQLFSARNIFPLVCLRLDDSPPWKRVIDRELSIKLTYKSLLRFKKKKW